MKRGEVWWAQLPLSINRRSKPRFFEWRLYGLSVLPIALAVLLFSRSDWFFGLNIVVWIFAGAMIQLVIQLLSQFRKSRRKYLLAPPSAMLLLAIYSATPSTSASIYRQLVDAPAPSTVKLLYSIDKIESTRLHRAAVFECAPSDVDAIVTDHAMTERGEFQPVGLMSAFLHESDADYAGGHIYSVVLVPSSTGQLKIEFLVTNSTKTRAYFGLFYETSYD